MTVHFIGAGPGAADLITVRGARLIGSCPVCLYAGSLVPPEIVALAPPRALVRDTASMHLDEIVGVMAEADARGEDVARVHSGDPSIYGAIAEQMRRLAALGIAYDVCPGVPAFAGAAAQLATELTLPEIAQTVVITRTEGKASPMPPRETLENIGRTGGTLAIHMSVRHAAAIERELAPHYGADCPVVLAYRATWPDEAYFRTDLKGMRAVIRENKLTRTVLILVGPAFGASDFRESSLYAEQFAHVLRNRGRKADRERLS